MSAKDLKEEMGLYVMYSLMSEEKEELSLPGHFRGTQPVFPSWITELFVQPQS